MKQVRWCLLGIIMSGAVLLSGCINTIGKLPENYQFDSTGETGVVAFSTRCNLVAGNISVTIDPVNDDGNGTNSYKMPCNDPSEPMSSSQLALASLPVGKYVIDDWTQQINYYGTAYLTYLKADNFRPIEFEIKPHHVTYIGQIQFSAGYDNGYEIRVMNNAREDIPKIKQQLPNIPAKAISLQRVVLLPKTN